MPTKIEWCEKLLGAPWFFLRTWSRWHRSYPRDSWWRCMEIVWLITTIAYAWEEYPNGDG